MFHFIWLSSVTGHLGSELLVELPVLPIPHFSTRLLSDSFMGPQTVVIDADAVMDEEDVLERLRCFLAENEGQEDEPTSTQAALIVSPNKAAVNKVEEEDIFLACFTDDSDG